MFSLTLLMHSAQLMYPISTVTRLYIQRHILVCPAHVPFMHLQIYDSTPFLAEHPGGADSIIIVAGADATEDFNAIHSKKASPQSVLSCIASVC